MKISNNCNKIINHYNHPIVNELDNDEILNIIKVYVPNCTQNMIDALYSLIQDIGKDKFINSHLLSEIRNNPDADYIEYYYKALGSFRQGTEYVYHHERRCTEWILYKFNHVELY
jgi:GH24 family phage-related lysozyme (muramidase)